MPLRLLLFSSSSTSFLSPLRPSLPLAASLLRASLRSRSLSTVLSSSNRRRPGGQQSAPNFIRKSRTFRYRDKEDSVMEEPSSNSNFNKKRAEGRDKNDFPKKELQLKKRPRANPTSTISFVQILGTGMDTQDTSPSVLLFFDHQRFIFNAGEGLQRFCTEHRIRLSKIDHIFLSRVCSETSGGLPGLLLTLAGMGDEGQSVNVWGPSDLKFLVDAMKSFIPNAAMVHSKSFGPAPSSKTILPELDQFKSPIVLVEDDVVKISAILLWPEKTDIYPSDQGASEVDGDEFSETLGEEVTIGSKMKLGDISVVYVCELAELKGKFRPEKAKDIYGIRPGPAYRELQLGTPVFSNKLKRMIEPNEVMDPSTPGPVVLLVDCPTFSHFQKLLSSDSLSSYYVDYSGEKTPKVVTLVIHLSPSSVVSSDDYQRWMKRFGSAQHVIAGHEKKNVEIPILRASARISARLNYLCPQYFPAPGFWSLEQSALPNPTSTSNTSLDTAVRISAENLLKFILRPRDKIGFDRQLVPNLMTPSVVLDDLLSEIPEIVEASDDVRQLWDDTEGEQDFMQEEPWLSENRVPNCLENVRRDDLEIVLLGTGSSQPSKYRNVTSIYINLFDKGGLLLDCGEGTLGQMKRRYGLEGADDAIRRLRCIWISHIHADHHAGLARILTQRRDLLKGDPHEPMLVVGPRQLKRYLDAYQRLEDLEMIFLDCRHTTETSLKAFQELHQSGSPPISSNGSSLFTGGAPMQSILKRPGVPTDMSVAIPFLHRLNKMLSDSGLEALVSFPVVHCPQAFGVLLKASERVNSVGKVIEGWKVVYSGDTRPCPELTEASRGATVLIHEATFEDGMVDEAIARNHSTTEEAIQVGAAAGVYRIILTHFSQRYPKIPVFDEQHMHKTCIAFDLMSVNIADVHVLPRVLPYLKLLFKNEMIVDESDDVAEHGG